MGNGEFNASGDDDVSNWQSNQSYSYSTVGRLCCGHYIKWHMELRGGSYSSAASTLRTSDRSKKCFSSLWKYTRVMAGVMLVIEDSSDVGGERCEIIWTSNIKLLDYEVYKNFKCIFFIYNN